MAIYSSLFYGLSSLKDGIFSESFLYFYLTMVVMNLICWSVAAIAVMLLESIVAAQALVPVYNAANLLFITHCVPHTHGMLIPDSSVF